MRIWRLTSIPAVLLLAGAVSSRISAQNRLDPPHPSHARPPMATRCDLSIPVHIEMAPLNDPQAGQVAQFRIDVGFSLDPDLVRSSWVEYDLPEGMRRVGGDFAVRKIMGQARTGRAQLEVVVPDARRYEIRARYVVQLTNGRTIAQTAVRHINIGNVPPEGMTGRVVDTVGNGIRVYRGLSVRN